MTRLINWMLILLLAAVADAGPLVDQLKEFDPLPKVTPTWAWNNRVMNDPELRQEMARVLRCASGNLRWDNAARIQKLVDTEPENIAFNWSPYHDKFNAYPRWTKSEVCGPITLKDMDYFSYFWTKASNAKALVGSIPVIMAFDHEIGCGDKPGVGDKLNIFYRMAKEIFGGDVFFYNHNQWIPSWLHEEGRISSPVPSNTHGDFSNLSLYYNAYSVEHSSRMELTILHTEGLIVPWLSVGSVYAMYPYKESGRTRSANVIWLEQIGETWHKSRILHQHPRVHSVFLWPEPLRPPKGSYPGMSDDHFIEYLRGALGIKRP